MSKSRNAAVAATVARTPKRDDPQPTMTRPRQLAKRWGVGITSIYRMLERGEIASKRLGSVVLIPLDAVIEWVVTAPRI
jgi:excisionase family DNA binding protein